MKARVAEIFESIQGEGIYQGVPQIFIRFYGCNLKCIFCDTVLKRFSWMTKEEVLEKMSRCKSNIHSVVLTGGEPLLQKDFLKELLPELRKRHMRIYLETNGILYRELSEVIDYLDIVAMDFKLPTSTALSSYWKEHEKFLSIAAKKEVFVKTVVSNATEKEDLQQAVKLILAVDKNIPFVLQPEYTAMRQNGLEKKLNDFKAMAECYLRNVKIIGQLHKLRGAR